MFGGEDYNELGRTTGTSNAAVVTGQTQGSNDIANDPMFSSPTSEDFNMMATCPLLHSAIPVGVQSGGNPPNRGAE